MKRRSSRNKFHAVVPNSNLTANQKNANMRTFGSVNAPDGFNQISKRAKKHSSTGMTLGEMIENTTPALRMLVGLKRLRAGLNPTIEQVDQYIEEKFNKPLIDKILNAERSEDSGA